MDPVIVYDGDQAEWLVRHAAMNAVVDMLKTQAKKQ